jgi:hypothetical protein
MFDVIGTSDMVLLLISDSAQAELLDAALGVRVRPHR